MIHLIINLYANESTILKKNSCTKNKTNVKKNLFITVIHVDHLKKIQKQSKTVFKTFFRQTTNSTFFFNLWSMNGSVNLSMPISHPLPPLPAICLALICLLSCINGWIQHGAFAVCSVVGEGKRQMPGVVNGINMLVIDMKEQ